MTLSECPRPPQVPLSSGEKDENVSMLLAGEKDPGRCLLRACECLLWDTSAFVHVCRVQICSTVISSCWLLCVCAIVAVALSKSPNPVPSREGPGLAGPRVTGVSSAVEEASKIQPSPDTAECKGLIGSPP